MKKLILILLFSTSLFAQSEVLTILMSNGTTADITAPSVPQNLVATGGTDLITLSWDENTAPDLYGYVIYRDSLGANEIPDSNSSFTNYGLSFWACGGGTLTHNDSGWVIINMTNDQPYMFRDFLVVGKTYEISFSAKSAGYTGQMDSYIGSGAHISIANLIPTWQRVIGKRTAAGNGWLVFQNISIYTGTIDIDSILCKEIITTTSHPDIAIDTVLAGTETFENTGLTAGTTYNYRIKALDNAGNLSDYSAKASGVPE